MPNVSGFNNGMSRGFGQGVGLYNALASAPIQRRKQLAEAEMEEKKLNTPGPDMVDLGMLDPSLSGHKIPTAQALPWLAAKKKEQAQVGPGGVGGGMTPGRKAADQTFGKDYVEWSQGGAPDTQAQLQNLKGTINTVKTDKSLAGPVRGAVPDFIRTFTNPEAVNVKQNVADVTQRTLRAILGAQFTEKEGERIIRNAYDDRLPPEMNAARLDRLFGKISQMAQAKQAMADYFEQYGTLTGYRGKMPSAADLAEFAGADDGQNQNAGPPPPGGMNPRNDWHQAPDGTIIIH